MKKYTKILMNVILTYLYAVIFVGCLWLGFFGGLWIENTICKFFNASFCILSSYGSYDGLAFTYKGFFLMVIPCTLIFFYTFYQAIQYITTKIEKNLKK